MKSSLIFLLLVFSCSLVFAQQDSGKATFHVKQNHTLDESNSIQFTYQCKGVYRTIFIDKNGNDYFYWGKPETTTSASFLADTVSVDTVKSIITPEFVGKLNKCYPKPGESDNKCNYFIVIIVNGEPFSATIDIDRINKKSCEYLRLERLISIMDTFYNRYAFPK
jgi:hypothetical protein